MKKLKSILSLLTVVMLFVSCSGEATPENKIAGYDTLIETVPSLEDLAGDSTFQKIETTKSLEGFEGTWVTSFIEEEFNANPKYAKKTTKKYEITANPKNETNHTYKITYIYDFTAAINDLGDSYWENIKENDVPNGYSFTDYVATQTTSNYSKDVSIFEDIFGLFYSPGVVDIWVDDLDSSKTTKIKIYDTISEETYIYIRQ